MVGPTAHAESTCRSAVATVTVDGLRFSFD